MKPILTITFILCSLFVKGQDTPSQFSAGISGSRSLKFSGGNTFPQKDTVKCFFLEVLNMDSATVKWTSGYIERHNGFIDFGKTSVQVPYLPITDGFVTSTLFYSDTTVVKNQAIKVLLQPITIDKDNTFRIH